MDKSQKIGALWRGKTKNGGDYFSGSIEVVVGQERIKIVVFPNGYKNQERSPDFIIYLSQPKPQEERPQYGYHDTTQPQAPAPPVEDTTPPYNPNEVFKEPEVKCITCNGDPAGCACDVKTVEQIPF